MPSTNKTKNYIISRNRFFR